MTNARRALRLSSLVLGGAIMMGGCSGATEDVRVTLWV